MNPYRALFRWLGRKRWFTAFGRKILTPLDKAFRHRRWSPTAFGTGFPMGYLTTRGRRSGEPRTVPLLYRETTDGHAAVVGTNFGEAGHPDWVLNLESDSKAKWKVREEHPVRARQATDLEYLSLWPQFVEVWPAYEDYVERSGRRPKMFILERRKS